MFIQVVEPVVLLVIVVFVENSKGPVVFDREEQVEEPIGVTITGNFRVILLLVIILVVLVNYLPPDPTLLVDVLEGDRAFVGSAELLASLTRNIELASRANPLGFEFNFGGHLHRINHGA